MSNTTQKTITNPEQTIESISTRLNLISAALHNDNLQENDIETVLLSINHADRELSEVLNYMNSTREILDAMKNLLDREAATA